MPENDIERLKRRIALGEKAIQAPMHVSREHCGAEVIAVNEIEDGPEPFEVVSDGDPDTMPFFAEAANTRDLDKKLLAVVVAALDLYEAEKARWIAAVAREYDKAYAQRSFNPSEIGMRELASTLEALGVLSG